MYHNARQCLSVCGLVTSICMSTVYSGEYSDAVSALLPTHYYRLNETAYGAVADVGTSPIAGNHEGDNAPTGIIPVVGDPWGLVGAVGPDVNVNGVPLTGFEAGNKSLFANGLLAVNLGAGTSFGNTTMTLATWFKVPCVEGDPGVTECQGPPASTGGERLFTNNIAGTNTGGTTDVDDLGHLQIDLGWGANLIVSIDNNFADPLHSNFQIPHRDNHPGPYGTAGPGSGLAVKDERWHHLVVSRNGDELTNMLLVIDGVNITQDRWADSTDSWGITGSDAKIGTRDPAPHDRTWNGWIDETALWLGEQLSVVDAQVLYHSALSYTAADFDASGAINGADVDALTAAIASGSSNLLYDLTADGVVSPADLTLWLAVAGNANLGAGRPYLVGDANLDGSVDGSDHGLWNSQKFTNSTAWTTGNFNADSVTDGGDFGLWNAHKFTSSDTMLVPEPAAATLLLVASWMVTARRRRPHASAASKGA